MPLRLLLLPLLRHILLLFCRAGCRYHAAACQQVFAIDMLTPLPLSGCHFFATPSWPAATVASRHFAAMMAMPIICLQPPLHTVDSASSAILHIERYRHTMPLLVRRLLVAPLADYIIAYYAAAATLPFYACCRYYTMMRAIRCYFDAMLRYGTLSSIQWHTVIRRSASVTAARYEKHQYASRCFWHTATSRLTLIDK